eukprot:sb/3468404/
MLRLDTSLTSSLHQQHHGTNHASKAVSLSVRIVCISIVYNCYFKCNWHDIHRDQNSRHSQRQNVTLFQTKPNSRHSQRQNVTLFQTKPNSRHSQRQNVTLFQTKPNSRHSQRQNVTLFQTKLNSRHSQRQNFTLFQNKPNSRLSQRQNVTLFQKLTGQKACVRVPQYRPQTHFFRFFLSARKIFEIWGLPILSALVLLGTLTASHKLKFTFPVPQKRKALERSYKILAPPTRSERTVENQMGCGAAIQYKTFPTLFALNLM